MYFNIHRLRSKTKYIKVRGLILSKSLVFIAIQESKMGGVSDLLSIPYGRIIFCNWRFSLFLGKVDGLLSIFCTSNGSSLFCFVGPGNLVSIFSGGG